MTLYKGLSLYEFIELRDGDVWIERILGIFNLWIVTNGLLKMLLLLSSRESVYRWRKYMDEKDNKKREQWYVDRGQKREKINTEGIYRNIEKSEILAE